MKQVSIALNDNASVEIWKQAFGSYIDTNFSDNQYMKRDRNILKEYLYQCISMASPYVLLTSSSTSGKYHSEDELQSAMWAVVYKGEEKNLCGVAYDSLIRKLIKTADERLMGYHGSGFTTPFTYDFRLNVTYHRSIEVPDLAKNFSVEYKGKEGDMKNVDLYIDKIFLVQLGGQYIHMLKVLQMTEEAIRRYGINNEHAITAIRLSALMHDICKFQKGKFGWQTTKSHPYDAAILMKTEYDRIKTSLYNLGDYGTTMASIIEAAIDGVKYHYGVWGSQEVANPSMMARFPIISIVQEADYYASRPFTSFDGIERNNVFGFNVVNVVIVEGKQ